MVSGYSGQTRFRAVHQLFKKIVSILPQSIDVWAGIPYPRVCHAPRLYQDDALSEFYAAYPHADGGDIPQAQDSRLDGDHLVPSVCVIAVGASISIGKRKFPS
jgi:hypothetical protein